MFVQQGDFLTRTNLGETVAEERSGADEAICQIRARTAGAALTWLATYSHEAPRRVFLFF